MKERIEELRAAVLKAKSEAQPGMFRYERALRAELLEAAKALRADGQTNRRIASALGVPEATIAVWLPRAGKLRPIELKTTRTSGGAIAITTPRGDRIEGLSVEDVVRVLAALR